MRPGYIKEIYESSKAAILHEILAVRGLIQLLMKRRNTGEAWTREEKQELKAHLRSISNIVPALIIFSLPGGGLLLPVLATALDRRRIKNRIKREQEEAESGKGDIQQT